MTKRYPISSKAHAFCGWNKHARPFGKRLANKSTRQLEREQLGDIGAVGCRLTMRRFTRHIFTILAALSLLLCVATGVLWVRGFFRTDVVQFPGRRYVAGSEPNALYINRASRPYWAGISYQSRPSDRRSSYPIWSWAWNDTFPNGSFSHFLGFSCLRFTQPNPAPPCRFIYLGVPWWFVFLCSAVAPTLWITKRRRDSNPYGCRICGYDLRATPDRCPECGTVPASSAVT